MADPVFVLIASGKHSNSLGNLVISIPQALPVGTFIRVLTHHGISSATDSRSNTYTSTFSASNRLHLDTVITTGKDLTTSDTITLNVSGSTGKFLYAVYAILNVDTSFANFGGSPPTSGGSNGVAVSGPTQNGTPVFADYSVAGGDNSFIATAGKTAAKSVTVTDYISSDSNVVTGTSPVTSETTSNLNSGSIEAVSLGANDLDSFGGSIFYALKLTYKINTSSGTAPDVSYRVTYNGENTASRAGGTIVGESWFVTATNRSDKIDCKRDEENGRRYTAAISATGTAVIYNDDVISTTLTSALTPVTVDAATDCISPNIWILEDKSLLYTYGKSGNIYWRKSTNLGKTWSAATMIAAGYTVHDMIFDLAGFFPVIAAFKSSDSKLYIITGKPDGSGGVTWNTPVSTGITAKEVSPALHVRNDSIFELTYVDNSSNIQIVRCSNLSVLGVGSWS